MLFERGGKRKEKILKFEQQLKFEILDSQKKSKK